MKAAPLSLDQKESLRILARQCGFDACGITTTAPLLEEEERYRQWLAEGRQGEMQWLERNTGKRLDPGKLMPGARSVICLIHNYQAEQEIHTGYKIARYAYGEDYHFVLKEKMRPILQWLEKQGSTIHRAFTDSAPLMERALAARAGLGWIGKNSLLLNRDGGSWFFLAEILTDLDIPPDEGGMRDYCGGCVQCITACPTQAITEARVLDARRCISYLTIELNKEKPIPADLAGQYQDWIFGCDICQEVCPWNREVKPNSEARFQPTFRLMDLRKQDWEEMDEGQFRNIFKKSALMRSGWKGLQRNIAALKGEERKGRPG
jgi:epoxyqueuosine reductase